MTLYKIKQVKCGYQLKRFLFYSFIYQFLDGDIKGNHGRKCTFQSKSTSPPSIFNQNALDLYGAWAFSPCIIEQLSMFLCHLCPLDGAIHPLLRLKNFSG